MILTGKAIEPYREAKGMEDMNTAEFQYFLRRQAADLERIRELCGSDEAKREIDRILADIKASLGE